MTQGPYYLDLDLVRTDIREDRPGLPLALSLLVVDAVGAPVKDATVDIWHCDAAGIYSGFQSASTSSNGGGGGPGGAPPNRDAGGAPPSGGGPGGPGGQPPAGGPPGGGGGGAAQTDDATFLRGTQVSGADGVVAFSTIYPGWYTGRTVHIHVMVHLAGKSVHTGQLFFDDVATDALYAANAPYSTRPARGTRNANDGIYQSGGAASILGIAKAGGGVSAKLTMAVKTT
jgi:hypothetical protein